MHLSVWPNPGRSTDELLDLARYADSNGWYSYWFADHYMPNTGGESIEPGDVHEVWGVLPAVAAVTNRIRLGPLVSPTSVHHPAVLANRAATIDHISNGRMVLGLGAGWQINEHLAYGIELEAPKQRVDRFEEAIEIVRRLLDEGRTTFSGTHYEIVDAPSDPKPVQARLPILVGTSGPRMCRITATHAQEWNTWGGPDEAAPKLATFLNACERVEVDPDTIAKSVQALFFVTDDAERIAEHADNPRAIAGSVGQIIDTLGRYADMGFDEVIVPDFTLGSSPERRRERYEIFTHEVMPHVC